MTELKQSKPGVVLVGVNGLAFLEEGKVVSWCASFTFPVTVINFVWENQQVEGIKVGNSSNQPGKVAERRERGKSFKRETCIATNRCRFSPCMLLNFMLMFCFKIRTNALSLVFAIRMRRAPTQKVPISVHACWVTLGTAKTAPGTKVIIKLLTFY